MKKVIYALILLLVVAGGFVFANRGTNNETPKKNTPKPNAAAERNAERKKWEATPPGIYYKKWEASPAGVKVLDGAAAIRKRINADASMEAVVTSLSLPAGSRLGFGVMAKIDGVDYILRFDANNAQLEQLHSLKLNDKLILKGHGVSWAPKYAYPIVAAKSVERDHKIIFKRIPPKGGC